MASRVSVALRVLRPPGRLTLLLLRGVGCVAFQNTQALHRSGLVRSRRPLLLLQARARRGQRVLQRRQLGAQALLRGRCRLADGRQLRAQLLGLRRLIPGRRRARRQLSLQVLNGTLVRAQGGGVALQRRAVPAGHSADGFLGDGSRRGLQLAERALP